MKISLQELRGKAGPFEAIAHSIEGSLYSVSVVLDGRECRLVGDNGKSLQGRSIVQVREMLKEVNLTKLTLRQVSAYDEMIGHAPREGANTLEVPVSINSEI